jgi:hypothetical protein
MSETGKYFFDRFLVILVLVAVFLSAIHIISKPSTGNEIHIHNHLPPQKKDSSTVKEMPPVIINNITYPDKVNVQEKPDTNLRNQAEKGTIIIGEQVKNGELIVQKIDTAGKKVEDKYKVNENESFDVDKNGNVQISEDKKKVRKEKVKKIFNRVLEGALFVAGFIIGKKF